MSDFEQFWKAPTKREAYILGFLWADGYLYQREKHHMIRLEIKTTDADSIADAFVNWNRYNQAAKRETWSPTSTFNTSNLNFFNFLVSKGYQNKESCALILDFLPISLHSYWWRGYTDGDGGFYTGGNYIRQWTMSGPYESDWSSLIQLADTLQIHNTRIKQYISKQGHRSSSVDIRGRDSLRKLGDYLYGSEWDQLGLPRKYAKYQECLIAGKEWRKRND
jgi:hypothetical protein